MRSIKPTNPLQTSKQKKQQADFRKEMERSWNSVKKYVVTYQTANEEAKQRIEGEILKAAYAFNIKEEDNVKNLLPNNLQEIKDRIATLKEVKNKLSTFKDLPTFGQIKEASEKEDKPKEILTFLEKNYNINDNNYLTSDMLDSLIRSLEQQQQALETLLRPKESNLAAFVGLVASSTATTVTLSGTIAALFCVVVLSPFFLPTALGACAIGLTAVLGVGLTALPAAGVYVSASALAKDERPERFGNLKEAREELIASSTPYIKHQKELENGQKKLKDLEEQVQALNKDLKEKKLM